MKKLFLFFLCTTALLPITARPVSFGDAELSSINYRINDALISRAYIANQASIACLAKNYPNNEQLPPPSDNLCSQKNSTAFPFNIVITTDGCVRLQFRTQGLPVLLAGNAIVSCAQVDLTTGKILSLAKWITYTNIGEHGQTNDGDFPLVFNQPRNFTLALALLGTDFSGSVFVNAVSLRQKAAVLQKAYEYYQAQYNSDTSTGSQTAYIST